MTVEHMYAQAFNETSGMPAPLADYLFIQLALVAVGSLLHPEACEMDYN